MNFEKLIKVRESCRNFTGEKVERETLIKIIEMATMAPSACNSQPWHFVVVDDEELVSKIPPLLTGGGFNGFTDKASAFIVVCETKAKLMKRILECGIESQHYAQMDIGIAMAHLTLAAADNGLGSCIIGYFDEPELKEILAIGEDKKVRLLLAVGVRTDVAYRTKARKPKEEVITINKG